MTDPVSIALPGGEHVALDVDGRAVRRDGAGGVIWLRAAVDADDRFVALELADGTVQAVSWRGVEHRLALTDGAVISTAFVK